MTTNHLTSKIGPDGVLEFAVPLDPTRANKNVLVTLDISDQPAGDCEEWVAFLTSVAGSIDDETFQRHPQGAFEERDEPFE